MDGLRLDIEAQVWQSSSTDSNFFEIYKEKEMADFRRWILALTVLALCVAGANAQIVGTGTGATFGCNAINGAVTPTLRSKGITDLVGDIVIQCTGGNTLAPGTQIPQANITVFSEHPGDQPFAGYWQRC